MLTKIAAILSLCIIVLITKDSDAFRGPFRTMFAEKIPPMRQTGVDPGKPLFLTPYINSGDLDKAKQLSLVGPLKGTSLKSYSGYLTVNKKYESNMFFWFFPAKVDPANAPVILWLQGGPGGTSLFGLFVESGPILVNKDFTLSERNVTWATKYSMLYIDNPVGTGFSFTNYDSGYATNEDDVARDLYSALTQFFTLFSEYQKNDFYIMGESYAGKYVPAISWKVHLENPTAKLRINLKGLAVGDGLCDPESMVPEYPDFLYQIGLFDETQRDYAKTQTDLLSKYIRNKQWRKAFLIFDTFLNGDTTGYPSYFTNATGSTFYFNYLLSKSPEAFDYYNNYLSKPEVRKSIHVGNLTFNDGSKVEKFLLNDVMQSIKPWMTDLMNSEYKVMIYSGQMDIIIAYPLTEAFIRSIDWKYAQEYKVAKRHIWKVNNKDVEVAGYVRQVKNFYQVMVRNGGHILPYDKPTETLDMINRFITGKPFWEN